MLAPETTRRLLDSLHALDFDYANSLGQDIEADSSLQDGKLVCVARNIPHFLLGFFFFSECWTDVRETQINRQEDPASGTKKTSRHTGA